MKIWIISSDSFLRDFEEIAKKWPSETEVLLTTVSKFGFGLGDFLSFYNIYKNFKPDVILTDHGYPVFWFIRKIRNQKIIFFLRGNYWLEEKLRNA
jgi:hypothetical protein